MTEETKVTEQPEQMVLVKKSFLIDQLKRAIISELRLPKLPLPFNVDRVLQRYTSIFTPAELRNIVDELEKESCMKLACPHLDALNGVLSRPKNENIERFWVDPQNNVNEDIISITSLNDFFKQEKHDRTIPD